jgi:ADP-ribose pyrophosphatase
MKLAISDYFSKKEKGKCFEEKIQLKNSCILFKNMKIRILPILIDYNNLTVASLKLPCDIENLFLFKESPLENVKLPSRKSKKKKSKTKQFQIMSSGSSSAVCTENFTSNETTKNDISSLSSTLKASSFLYNEIGNIYCRNQKYPLTECDRYPVPDNKIHFRIEYNEYENDIIPFIDLSNNLVKIIKNKNDIDLNYLESLKILLKNPIGRTGIIGKGLLKTFGANKFAFIVITKYKRSSSGAIEISENENMPNYEFLALKNKYFNNEWIIPNGYFENNDYFLNSLPKPLANHVLCKNAKVQFLEKLYYELFINPILVYNEYLDDYLNTDNAWILAYAENFHHESDDVQFKLNEAIDDSEMNPERIEFEWISFQNNKIYPPHKTILNSTKRILDSNWYNKTS